MNKKELAEKIRILRKNKGYRQEDLAAKAGVSIRVVKDLESATGNPTLASLDLIVSVLEVALPQILMPGMEAFNQVVVNAPGSVGSNDGDHKNKKAHIATSIGIFGEQNSNAQWDKNKSGGPGKPPHEMSVDINKVSHTASSDTNKESFTPNKATLILEIQSLLTQLSDDDLEIVKMTAEGRLELSQSEKTTKQAKG